MSKNIYKLWLVIPILLLMALACSSLVKKSGLSTTGGETAGKIISITATPRPSVGLSGAIFAPASHTSDALPAALFISRAAPVTPTPTMANVRQFPEGLYSVAFSPDGTKIVAAEGAYGRVWLATGQFYNLVGHEDLVNSAVFSPDSQWVVTASQDGTARLWVAGIEGGNLIGKFEVQDESAKAVSVNAAAFSPDGRNIITGSDDGTIRFWDIIGKTEIAPRRDNQGKPVKLMAVNPKVERMILTVDDENIARLWNGNGEQPIYSSEEEEEEKDKKVYSIAFSADGTRIALGRNGEIEVRGFEEETPFSTTLTISDSVVTSVAFHFLYSNIIVTASSDQTVRLWDTSLEEEKRQLERLEQPNVTSVAFSRNNIADSIYEFTTAGKDGTIQVWRYNAQDPGAPPGQCVWCR